MLVGDVGRRSLVDAFQTVRRQRYDHAAAVVRIVEALDEALLFQLVDAVGHRAGADHRGRQQIAGGELKGRSGAPERSKHVEAGRGQSALGKRLFDLASDMVAQPCEAAEKAHGRNIEVRSFALPLRQNPVDVIHPSLHPLVSNP
ncbi:hypothetical protein D3C72_1851630 [compost metagenome]